MYLFEAETTEKQTLVKEHRSMENIEQKPSTTTTPDFMPENIFKHQTIYEKFLIYAHSFRYVILVNTYKQIHTNPGTVSEQH